MDEAGLSLLCVTAETLAESDERLGSSSRQRKIMTKSKDVVGGFDATHCSTAIQVLRLLRNAIEKEAGTAIARADNMEGVIRSQWIMKFNTFNEVLDMIDMTIKSIPTENPYEHCKTFSEVCQTFMEEDPQMQRFFGKGAKQ